MNEWIIFFFLLSWKATNFSYFSIYVSTFPTCKKFRLLILERCHKQAILPPPAETSRWRFSLSPLYHYEDEQSVATLPSNPSVSEHQSPKSTRTNRSVQINSTHKLFLFAILSRKYTYGGRLARPIWFFRFFCVIIQCNLRIAVITAGYIWLVLRIRTILTLARFKACARMYRDGLPKKILRNVWSESLRNLKSIAKKLRKKSSEWLCSSFRVALRVI